MPPTTAAGVPAAPSLPLRLLGVLGPLMLLASSGSCTSAGALGDCWCLLLPRSKPSWGWRFR